MNVRQWILMATLASSFVASASAAIPIGGRVDDESASLLYDFRDGNLQFEGGTQKITGLVIGSAGNFFTGPQPPNCPGMVECLLPNKLILIRPGASAINQVDFGPVLTRGLSVETLAADLTVVGSVFPEGPLQSVDLIYVPEPTSLTMLAPLPLLFLRRRKV